MTMRGPQGTRDRDGAVVPVIAVAVITLFALLLGCRTFSA